MTTIRSIRLLVVVCGVLGLSTVSAQQPAPTQPAPVQGAAAQTAATSAPPQSYTYDASGRRDPFVSLLRRGSDTRGATGRPAGVPGLYIGEVTIKGILKDRSGFIAMIQGPDNKQTYVVRTGEKLMDGTVKAIMADAVVFSQDINDPLSLVKQKEVRKTIRSADGGRS